MDQDEVYETARSLLREITDACMTRLTIGEALFLFRQCMWTPKIGLNVVVGFSEDDLSRLIDIVRNVRLRGGPDAVH